MVEQLPKNNDLFAEEVMLCCLPLFLTPLTAPNPHRNSMGMEPTSIFVSMLCYSVLCYYDCFCCCWVCLHLTQGIFQNSNEREVKCFGKSEHTHV